MSCARGPAVPPAPAASAGREPGPAWPWKHCRDLLLSVWGRPECLTPSYPLEAEFNSPSDKSTPLRVRETFLLGQVNRVGTMGPGFRPQSRGNSRQMPHVGQDRWWHWGRLAL